MLPEGRVDLVVPSGAERAVLALHPHPDMGGNRFHPVVSAVFDAAVASGWAACRFDFSSSAFDVAGAELTAALDLLPSGPVTVAGYSFGALVAAQVVDPRIEAWVLVAPPFGRLVAAQGLPVGPEARPKLLLVPAHDQFCPPAAAAAGVADWTATTVEAIAGADHFLAGAAPAVAARVIAWARLSGGR